ncbi:hypothetical protein GCM10009766_03610 [Microcella frigidaquae]
MRQQDLGIGDLDGHRPQRGDGRDRGRHIARVLGTRQSPRRLPANPRAPLTRLGV